MLTPSWESFCQSKANAATQQDLHSIRRQRARELRGYRIVTAMNALLLTASRGETITYSDLNAAIHSSSRWEIEWVLRAVLDICAKNKWPLLPCLVHSVGNDAPSNGFYSALIEIGLVDVDLKKLRDECYSSDLPDIGDVLVQCLRWRMGL